MEWVNWGSVDGRFHNAAGLYVKNYLYLMMAEHIVMLGPMWSASEIGFYVGITNIIAENYVDQVNWGYYGKTPSTAAIYVENQKTGIL